MAILHDEQTGKKLHLHSSHIFGRDPGKADTLLRNGDASQIHAAIRWDGNRWEITDYSRNGTTINGKRLLANTRHALGIGQKIQCAPGADAIWVVESLAPPAAMLVSSDRSSILPLSNFQLLPDETAPEASVYLSSSGQWICESSTESQILQDGDTIRFGGQAWEFRSAPPVEATSDVGPCRPRAPDTLFNFTVSQNEEHTSLTVLHAQTSVALGERAHHYSLLTLARRRLDDAGRGIEESSQGWIDIERVSKMLGLDPAHLNIQIFRARNQIARAVPGSDSLSNVIERRRGEVRFGAFRFQIVRGASVEGVFNPSPDSVPPAAQWNERAR